MKLKKSKNGSLSVVKTSGFKLDKNAKNVNSRAGLAKNKKSKEGENLVKRRKPLALKHVRRLRKFAIALSCVFVSVLGYVSMGFIIKSPVEELPEADYATVCLKAPESGVATDYTIVENVGFMNYVLQNQPYWSSEMHSTVYTVMQQQVHTYKQYYNNVLISADIAEGVSSEATQYCVANGVVLWRGAENKNFNGINTQWQTKQPQGLSVQQFKQKRGFPPSEFSVYVLNEYTIKNANDYTAVDNGNGTYTITLDLNVNMQDGLYAADYYYKQQMYVTGGLDERPVIDSTTVTYTFDSSWRVLEFSISDSYTAKMGIKVSCTSATTTVFSYDEDKAANTFYDDYFKAYVNNFDESDTNATNEPNALNYLAAAFGSVLDEGATFKVNFGLDKLDMSGVVHVGLENGALNDIRVVLGDISVFTGADNILYVSDGKAKYKLDTGALSSGSVSNGEGGAALDLGSITDKLTAGSFTVSETEAKLDTVIDLFGFEINLHFTFKVADNNISLGYVSAEIPVGNTTLRARLSFGTKDDIPQKPADMSGYTDILNDGITLNTTVFIDSLKLSGIIKIMMSDGALKGVYADLGDFSVLYDCTADMLYLTDSNVKYKLSLQSFGGDGLNFSGISFDSNSILSHIIGNLRAENGEISTAATLNVLEQTVFAAVAIKLTGGISVNANLNAFSHNITATVGFSTEEVVLPDLSEYVDVLNEGVTLSVNFSIDGFQLDGLVYIGLKDGKFTDLRADFGEIALYYADDRLYITDGTVKYMISVPQGNGSVGPLNFDFVEIIKNLNFTEGGFNTELAGEALGAMLEVSIFGGINVNANVNAFGKNVTATVGFSTEEVVLPDLSEYVDVLNEGVTLSVNFSIDGFQLDGLVYIGLKDGKFTDLRADLGEIALYYENGRLYLTDGTVKYMLRVLQDDGSFVPSDFDLATIINSLTFTAGGFEAKLTGESLGAVLEVGIFGGFKVNINADAFGKTLFLEAEFSAEQVAMPNLSEYVDVINEGISLSVSAVIDEKDNLGDGEIQLNGNVFIGLSEGKLTEIRADFGEIAVYFDNAEQLLYVKIGNNKYKLDIGLIQPGASIDFTSLLPDNVSVNVGEILNNIVAEFKQISINTEIGIFDALVPVSAKLSFDNGLNAEFGLEIAGVKVGLSARFSNEQIPALGDGEKQEYINVIEDIWGAVESVIGNSITAEVSGKLYSYDNSKYAQYGYVKYNFTAVLEYDYRGENKRPVTIDNGTFNVDSEVYLHFNLNLSATSNVDNSLGIDVILMDANPNTSSNGVTGGGYYKDGALDVFVSVSQYSPDSANYSPLQVYAPMDEIMTLLVMVGSAANLDKLSFENNAELNSAVSEITSIVDSLLIENYIPNTKDQFASLGASLIPQILGVSLQEYLDEILSSLSASSPDGNKTDNRGKKPVADYVTDISFADNSLKVTLDSALIYNKEMPADDFIVIEINTESFDGGCKKLTDISLKNVYFGENNVNELDMALSLKYGEVQRPDEQNGLNGYINFDGIDTLLKALVNSATHKTDGGDNAYELNRYYLLNGSFNATISVIGINIGVNIDLNSIAVNIDENNNVAIDAHISYQSVQQLNQIAINGDTDLYLSIRNDMIYLKRVQKTYWEKVLFVTTEKTYETPVVEYRVMTLDAFRDDIINQLIFMFNFGSLVSDNLQGVGSNGGGGSAIFDNRDLGNLLNYVLAYYTCEENDGGASWNFAINGQMLTDLVGMTMSDIPITINAEKNSDGTYIIKGLKINQSSMKLVGSIVTLNFSGYLNYCNPNEVENHGYTDTSVKLDQAAMPELNGISWNEVLGGNSFEDISKVINWDLLTADTGLKYLSFGNGSPIGVAPLRYLYASDESNTRFEQWGNTCTALYNGNTGNVYTYSVAPDPYDIMPKVENMTAVWQSGYEFEDGTLVVRAVYDTTYKITIDSIYPTDGDYLYNDDAGIWNYTVEEAYGSVLLPVNAYYTDGYYTYGLKYYVDERGNVCASDNTAYNNYGLLCLVMPVSGDKHYTAVWERVYEIKFVAEFDGTSREISRYYYENDNLLDNLPDVPHIGGYKGEWILPENTVISPGSDLVIYAEYTIVSYTVNLVSAQAVTNENFIAADGGYSFAQNYLYASRVTLDGLNPVSSVYVFKGFYNNPEFTGNPVTEFIVTNDVTYYAKWEGKAVNVTYKSDLPFGNAKLGEDNFYSFKVVMHYGLNESLANFTQDGYIFLGWYAESNGAYTYVASADELKSNVESIAAASESVDVTLWAVWAVDDIRISLTKVTGSKWAFTGTYALNYADGISAIISQAADIKCSVSVTYYAHGKKLGGAAFSYDNIGTATFSGTSGSLDKSGMNCGNGFLGSNLSGSVTVKATFSCGGATLGSSSEFEQFCNKS